MAYTFDETSNKYWVVLKQHLFRLCPVSLGSSWESTLAGFIRAAPQGPLPAALNPELEVKWVWTAQQAAFQPLQLEGISAGMVWVPLAVTSQGSGGLGMAVAYLRWSRSMNLCKAAQRQGARWAGDRTTVSIKRHFL